MNNKRVIQIENIDWNKDSYFIKSLSESEDKQQVLIDALPKTIRLTVEDDGKFCMPDSFFMNKDGKINMNMIDLLVFSLYNINVGDCHYEVTLSGND